MAYTLCQIKRPDFVEPKVVKSRPHSEHCTSDHACQYEQAPGYLVTFLSHRCVWHILNTWINYSSFSGTGRKFLSRLQSLLIIQLNCSLSWYCDRKPIGAKKNWSKETRSKQISKIHFFHLPSIVADIRHMYLNSWDTRTTRLRKELAMEHYFRGYKVSKYDK